MNFLKKIVIKKMNEKYNFLKLNLKKDFLIKVIYNETMLFLRNKDNINKIKEFFVLTCFSLYFYINKIIKSIFNYENDLFFIKQILFFIIVVKYLFFVIIKKIIFSNCFNYSILFIKCNKKKNLKNKDIVDLSSKNNLLKNINNNFNFIFDDIIFFISSIIYDL
ncbi:MAG: hypothetical protein NVS86_00160 [Candidatus Carsonella ruddii]|nr:MAG: hypothetical protein NVS86_00160 [Candidatus Carsonella ruddii]